MTADRLSAEQVSELRLAEQYAARRLSADGIRKVAAALGWSGWAADYIDPDVDFDKDAVEAEHRSRDAVHRTAALREAAAALQAVIDRNAPFKARSQSHVALCGAREIVLGLIDGKRRGGVVTPRISAVEQDAWLALVARIGYSAAQRAWPVVSATLARARAESTAKAAS